MTDLLRGSFFGLFGVFADLGIFADFEIFGELDDFGCSFGEFEATRAEDRVLIFGFGDSSDFVCSFFAKLLLEILPTTCFQSFKFAELS